MSSIKLPEVIALHPLAGTVLLPRAHTTIHFQKPEELAIFEKGLVTEGRFLGLIQPKPLLGDGFSFFRHGALARITGFHEAELGGVFVSLTGVSRFEVLENLPSVGDLRYARVSYDSYHHDLIEMPKDPFVDRSRLLNALKIYLHDQDIAMDWNDIDDISDEFLLNSLAQTCPFDNVEKQALLETKTLAERYEIMTTLIEIASLTHKRNGVSYH